MFDFEDCKKIIKRHNSKCIYICTNSVEETIDFLSKFLDNTFNLELELELKINFIIPQFTIPKNIFNFDVVYQENRNIVIEPIHCDPGDYFICEGKVAIFQYDLYLQNKK